MNHDKDKSYLAPADEYNKMISRDEVIKCPHMMVLLGYLNKEHNIPQYGWKSKGIRYHYTDATGLVGMVTSGRLWATDIRFLNDPSEGTFLPDTLLRMMEAKAGGTSQVERNIIDGIKVALRNPRSKHVAFCTSLSAESDLLSQWRGYGSFGEGYAIGFNLGTSYPHFQIAHYYDVIYGNKGLEIIAEDLLDLFVSSSEKFHGEFYDEWASTLAVIAKSYKDDAYSEEKESRLVCSRSSTKLKILEQELPLNFRTRGSDVIPYVAMSLELLGENEQPRLPITEIVVGPGVDFDRNFASIKMLLETYLYSDVEIKRSRIPFRNV